MVILRPTATISTSTRIRVQRQLDIHPTQARGEQYLCNYTEDKAYLLTDTATKVKMTLVMPKETFPTGREDGTKYCNSLGSGTCRRRVAFLPSSVAASLQIEGRIQCGPSLLLFSSASSDGGGSRVWLEEVDVARMGSCEGKGWQR